MSNRVEDLERQVAELQAAVNGLTEELVEMKERVRQLEDAQEVTVDAETDAAAPEASPSAEEPSDASDASTPAGAERRTHSDDHVEVVERTGGPSNADGPGGDESEGATADSPAVNGEEPVPEAAAGDGGSADADGGDAEDGESDDSDIIVA
ncbi:DUF7518 family protein [Halorubrum halodurans]|uniref:BZIP transcription factor n=1 Tax=Halorubrum halodurans TaxID=1383851 RepID=A0A256IC05_9EURY|nr:bZIP transcription factor [Halorubrum halodurans]OYR54078.1 hypothetical protein DJ70_14640 [Halorubrum halodurans]